MRTVFSAPPGPVLRHGKRLLWRFGTHSLVLHLGMTGKWTRVQPKFGKLKLVMEDGPIWFSDPRLLGGVVPATAEEAERQWKDGLGPDALGNPLPPLRGKRPVKVALMDQSYVAGLGNVQAMEALWRAGIHPARLAQEVVGEEHQRLSEAVQEQLQFTLDILMGEEEIVYVEESAEANPFPLYQREGEPCPRCTTPILRMVQSGRGTWWCPRCQPSPNSDGSSSRSGSSSSDR